MSELPLAAGVGFRPPRGWTPLPATLDALGGPEWTAWARAWAKAAGEDLEAAEPEAGSSERDALPYPVNVVHDELSAVPAGASVAVFGCGRQQARLYVLVPDPGLDETAREELLGVIQAWAGRYSGVGMLGPRADLAFFEIETPPSRGSGWPATA